VVYPDPASTSSTMMTTANTWEDPHDCEPADEKQILMEYSSD
jgi:hypothetical protein